MKLTFFIFIFLNVVATFAQITPGDTVFIVRDTSQYGNYHAIYIERNIHTEFFKRRTNFVFDQRDSLSYDESIKDLFGDEKPQFKKAAINKTLPRQWCELHLYEGDYYLYSPSDWGNNDNVHITDSTFIHYTMDGPGADIIEEYRESNPNTFEFKIKGAYDTSTKIIIRFIDRKNNIAVFDYHSDEGDMYSLMIASSNASDFPMIVNYSVDQKWVEYEFEKIDYKKILSTASLK